MLVFAGLAFLALSLLLSLALFLATFRSVRTDPRIQKTKTVADFVLAAIELVNEFRNS